MGYVDSAVKRSNALLAGAIKVAGMHPERDAVDARQAKTRDMGEVFHGQRRTSLVLVTRTQVQPVSLQTRSSLAARRTVVVVAREELALVDPQLTVEEMQLFHARMRMRGVTARRARGVPAC